MTTSTTRREEMMDRVKKLLNMTEEKGCSASEAQVALGKVQSILVEYNISMKDVVIDEKDEITKLKTSAGANLHRSYFASLAQVIAKNFRCKVYATSQSSRSSRAMFYGRESDIQSAEMAFRYAYNVAWYGVRRERDEHNKRHGTDYTVREFNYDYYTGFVNGLQDYFHELVSSKGKGYELMLVLENEVIESYDKLDLVKMNSTTSAKESPDLFTYSTGYRDGNKAMEGMNSRIN